MTSDYRDIPIILEFMLKYDSILDIGMGNGKYGFLYNEYTGRKIDGVEAHKLTNQKYFYNKIYNKPLADFTPKKKYDLMLWIDVLEHLVDPIKEYRRLRPYAKVHLISTPKTFYIQDTKGNPFDQHRSWVKPWGNKIKSNSKSMGGNYLFWEQI